MSWQLLIGISVLLYAISVILQRILLKNDKSDPISFSIFFQIGVAIVIGILVLIMQGRIPLPSLNGIGWSVLAMTVSYALANIFIFKSLKVTEASRFTVIFASKTLFAILASTLFFGEGLTSTKWLGAILIIVGVIAVSIKDTKLNLNKGDLYALIAAVLFGLANTNDRFLVRYFDPYSYVVLGFLLPGLLIGVIYPNKLSLIKVYLEKTVIYKMILLCLLYGLAAVAFFASLQNAPNSSEIFSVNAFGAIITVLLSIIFLKERDYLVRKIIGAIISLSGLLLVNK